MPRSPANSRYYQVAQKLRQAIEKGVYGPNGNLPPVRALAQQNGCSVFTIHRAVKLLKDEGVVSARQGSGIQVKSDAGRSPQRILLIVPDWSYGAHGAARHYGGQMLLGVTAAGMELGYSVDVIPVDDVIGFGKLAQRLKSTAYCGAILADIMEPTVPGIMESLFPRFVCTHRALPGQTQPAVMDDFEAAFDQLITEFKRRNFQRIAIMAQRVDDLTFQPVLEVLQEKLKEAGLEQVALFHRNEGLDAPAKDILWERFFADAVQAEACFSFVPNVVDEGRQWLAARGRSLEDELFLCTHSINSFPVDGCHLVLESELLEHGRAAAKALHDWNTGADPRDPKRIPIRFVYRNNI